MPKYRGYRKQEISELLQISWVACGESILWWDSEFKFIADVLCLLHILWSVFAFKHSISIVLWIAGMTYQCTHCSRSYPSERILRDHMRHHVNHYKCQFCDMTCPTPHTLSHHIRHRHLDEKPFSCEYCDYKWVYWLTDYQFIRKRYWWLAFLTDQKLSTTWRDIWLPILQLIITPVKRMVVTIPAELSACWIGTTAR